MWNCRCFEDHILIWYDVFTGLRNVPHIVAIATAAPSFPQEPGTFCDNLTYPCVCVKTENLHIVDDL